MNSNLSIPSRRIEKFCNANKIKKLAVFGSVLREDFGPDSDIDLLVLFQQTAHPTLFDMSRMESELKILFKRNVDLVSWRGIENSANHYRRNAILESAELLYGS